MKVFCAVLPQTATLISLSLRLFGRDTYICKWQWHYYFHPSYIANLKKLAILGTQIFYSR